MNGILNRLKYGGLCITSRNKNNVIQYITITTYKLLYHGMGIQRTQIIENSEKKPVRIITLSGYSSHGEPLFKQLNILKIADQLRLQELRF